jgi:hypothetical protein
LFDVVLSDFVVVRFDVFERALVLLNQLKSKHSTSHHTRKQTPSNQIKSNPSITLHPLEHNKRERYRSDMDVLILFDGSHLFASDVGVLFAQKSEFARITGFALVARALELLTQRGDAHTLRLRSNQIESIDGTAQVTSDQVRR